MTKVVPDKGQQAVIGNIWYQMSKDTNVEEYFDIDIDPGSPCVIQSPITYILYTAVILIYALGFVYKVSYHHHRWVAPHGANLQISLLLIGFVIITAIFCVPRKLVITPGSPTCLYYIGLGLLSVCRKIPVSEIEGVLLDLTTREKYVRAQLVLRWRVSRAAFTFATYSSKETALRRALFVSDRTGLSLLTYDMLGAVRPLTANTQLQGDAEENFEQCDGDFRRFDFHSLSQCNVRFFLLCVVWAVVIIMVGIHLHRWAIYPGIRLNVAVIYSLFTFALSLRTMPQLLTAVLSEESLSYSWGYLGPAFQRTIRLDQVKGLTIHTGFSGYYGRKWFLSIKWSVFRHRLEFGVYSTKDTALERAEYISGLTGIPIIKSDRP